MELWELKYLKFNKEMPLENIWKWKRWKEISSSKNSVKNGKRNMRESLSALNKMDKMGNKIEDNKSERLNIIYISLFVINSSS